MTSTGTAFQETISIAPAAHDYVRRARELIPFLQEHAAANDEGRRLTPEVYRALADGGFYRLTVPSKYGGPDLTLAEIMRILETLAIGDASSAWCVWAGLGLPAFSAFLSDEAARALAAPGISSASSVSRPGKAVATDGGFIVSARWPFLSNSPHASWIGGPVILHEGAEPRVGLDGQPAVVFAIVPAEKVQVFDTWYTTGLRGTGSVEGAVTDLFVPDPFILDFGREPAQGLDPLHYINIDTAANVTAAAMALGIARRAIDAFADLAPRKQRPDGSVLAEGALAKLAIAEAEIRFAQARGHLYEVAERAWEAQADGGMAGEAWLGPTSLASTGAVDAAVEIVSKVYRAAATSAVFATSPLDRCLRDIYTLSAHVMVQRENLLLHGGGQFARGG